MKDLTTHTQSFYAGNVLTVTIGHNGSGGGNHSHGGRTTLRLRNEGGTAWRVKVDGKVIEDPTEIEIALGGDHEAWTFVESLEFAAKRLRGMVGNGSIGRDEESNGTEEAGPIYAAY